MKSRKSSLAINLIIATIILLVVFFVIMAIFSDKFHFIDANFEDCEAKGASCVKESECLPPSMPWHYKCEQTGKEKIICCR